MFPVYADENVSGIVLAALHRRGWNIVRATAVLPGEPDDEVQFAMAQSLGRVVVTNDEDFLTIASRCFSEGRRFAGVVYWPQDLYSRATAGDIVRRLDALDADKLPDRVHFL